ncbi:acyl-CoA synthetase family member 3 [Cochliomyia hominivorax]
MFDIIIMKYFNHGQIFLFRRMIFHTSKSTGDLSNLKPYEKLLKQGNKIDPIFKSALQYANNNCITDSNGQYNYMKLYASSKSLSRQISNICGSGSCSTIAFFTSNDALAVLILWAIWMSGQAAMLLKYDESFHQLCELLRSKKSRLIITPHKYENLSKQLALKNDIALLILDHNFFNTIGKDSNEFKTQIITHYNQLFQEFFDSEFYTNSAALIDCTNQIAELETRVLNHNDLNYMFRKSVLSWNITESDKILYVAPLYQRFHNDFIFNLLFPLSVGSHVYIVESFDAKSVWRIILGINVGLKERINVFAAEPNVYLEMIKEFDKTFDKDHKMPDYVKTYCRKNIRLMLSCFTSLDPEIFSRWLQISGHSIFETNTLSLVNNIPGRENHLTLSKSSNIRMRIVDSNNQMLMELDQTSKIFHYPAKVIVGRLLVTKHPYKTYVDSGEVVSYCKGVLKKIGRYNI